MRRFAIAAVALALALPIGMAFGEETDEKPGNLSSVTYWSVNDAEGFEAGLKAHNALHEQQNDPSALYTWRVVSGKRNGQYLRVTVGHHWQDFDQEQKMSDADAADSAINLDPYITAAEPAIYRFMPTKVSGQEGEGEPKALIRVMVFELKFGHQREF